jgi:hypothetical protein
MISRVIVTGMDVYLVPVGPNRFELYCESAEDAATPVTEKADGPWSRRRWKFSLVVLWKQLQQKFNLVLAAIEREQDRVPAAPASPRESGGIMQRLRARGLRWVAERIAEQRLLWKLRGQSKVRAYFPFGLDTAAALATIRESLGRDLSRHLRWLAVDAIGGLFSLLLVPLPGPNVPGYYFTFRLVGHLLAIEGARQGLRVVSWDLLPSAPLAELAGLERLPSDARASRVRAIAAELGLPRLARFFERTAVEIA